MSQDSKTTSHRGDRDIPQNDAERIADDIRWLFREREGWAFSTDEIVEGLNATEARVVEVLGKMENVGELESKRFDRGRLWSLTP